MELIEEFVVNMLIGHQIQVTQINFNEQGLDKITITAKPKERIKIEPEPDERNAKINRKKLVRVDFKMYTSAGRIVLGKREEVEE
jgi:hypothetical protein